MADEQYEWLDKEAAEKMLRGEPVDPADGRPRQEAERLATALDAVARTARPAAGELPGEAAALAAFRAARRPAPRTPAVPAPADSAGRGRSAGAGGSAASGMLAPVRIRPAGSGEASPSGPRPLRWSRPLRFGLVASLACCAIGGVAVAAGTGVLPGPFGRHAPAPATSVSAAASPEELGSGLTTDDEGSAPPPGAPGEDTAAPDAPGADRTAGPEDGRADAGGRTPEEGRQGTDEDDTGDGRTGGVAKKPPAGTGPAKGQDGQDGDGASGDTEDKSSAWYAKTLKACRDYRNGKLDDERKKRLEALAKGAHNLDRFCDRLLNQAGGKNGGQNGDDSAGDDGSSGGGSGALPSIGFTPVAPEPTTDAGSPASGTSHSPEPALSLAAR
ncbi:hypothetical protein ABZS83_03965 [Streptomyces sp. NPDC005426]|uniref:hypothetical protein n=1 Tax=Streptomyces sp. NPDC005426 TaxID=3155344 RepID=UPI0033B74059